MDNHARSNRQNILPEAHRQAAAVACTLLVVLSLALLVAPVVTEAQTDRSAIVEFCKSVEGKEFYLKIGLINIKTMDSNINTPNVYPGPEVWYGLNLKSTKGYKKGIQIQIQSSDAEDFAEEVRLEVANMEDVSVHHYKRGTKVRIEKSKMRDDGLEFNIQEIFGSKIRFGGSKTKVRFRFDKKQPDMYNPANVMEMFAFTFAATMEELEKKTVELMLGMSIEEIVQLKGKPLTRVNLGAKTVISYDDITLIFQDGGLSDAQ